MFFAVGHVPHRAQNKSQCAAQQRDQAVVRRVGRVEKCITVRCQSLLVQESNHEDGQDGTDDLDAPRTMQLRSYRQLGEGPARHCRHTGMS